MIAWLRRNGWNLGVLVTVLIAAGGGLRQFGRLEERADSAHERVSRLEYQVDKLDQKLDEGLGEIGTRLTSQLAELERAKQAAVSEVRAVGSPIDDPVVFENGRLSSGLDMGVDSSGGRRDWLEVKNGMMCMAYPSGQQWGVVFITVGPPSQPPRAARDFSMYRSMVVEVRGANGGETVLVGLKDNTDPDDGSETKVRLPDLGVQWQTHKISLSRFRTVDLARLYVPAEFVFEGIPTEICVRKIEFLR